MDHSAPPFFAFRAFPRTQKMVLFYLFFLGAEYSFVYFARLGIRNGVTQGKIPAGGRGRPPRGGGKEAQNIFIYFIFNILNIFIFWSGGDMGSRKTILFYFFFSGSRIFYLFNFSDAYFLFNMEKVISAKNAIFQ